MTKTGAPGKMGPGRCSKRIRRLATPPEKGVRRMVTYSELFQLLMFLVAFAGLIISITNKK